MADRPAPELTLDLADDRKSMRLALNSYDPHSEQVILSLRNSGLGWISFRFEPDKFQALLDEARRVWGV